MCPAGLPSVLATASASLTGSEILPLLLESSSSFAAGLPGSPFPGIVSYLFWKPQDH